MNKNSLIYIGKWILVLPCSVLAFFVALIVWRVFDYLTMSFYFHQGSVLHNLYNEVISTAISTVAFIFSGTSIAPSHNKETALVLMILMCCFYGSVLFMANFMTYDYFANIGLVAGIIAAGAAYYQLRNIEDSNILS